MHEIDDRLDRADGRLGEDAVTEVEDVTGLAADLLEHARGVLLGEIARSEQHGGIEVALNRLVRADLRPALLDRRAPVEADDGPARFALRFEEVIRAGAE